MVGSQDRDTSPFVAGALVALVLLAFVGVFGIYSTAATSADEACLAALQVPVTTGPEVLAEARRVAEADCGAFNPRDVLGLEGGIIGAGVVAAAAVWAWQRFKDWRDERAAKP